MCRKPTTYQRVPISFGTEKDSDVMSYCYASSKCQHVGYTCIYLCEYKKNKNEMTYKTFFYFWVTFRSGYSNTVRVLVIYLLNFNARGCKSNWTMRGQRAVIISG